MEKPTFLLEECGKKRGSGSDEAEVSSTQKEKGASQPLESLLSTLWNAASGGEAT